MLIDSPKHASHAPGPLFFDFAGTTRQSSTNLVTFPDDTNAHVRQTHFWVPHFLKKYTCPSIFVGAPSRPTSGSGAADADAVTTIAITTAASMAGISNFIPWGEFRIRHSMDSPSARPISPDRHGRRRRVGKPAVAIAAFHEPK